MAEEELKPTETIELALKVAKRSKRQYSAKFTAAKKKIFLDAFAENLHQSQAAHAAGVSVMTVQRHRNSDMEFARSYQEVMDTYLDGIVSTRVKVALLPSREGHQDAKMLLAAFRRNEFGQKVDVNQNVNVKVDLGFDKMVEILQANNLIKIDTDKEIPDIDFEEVETPALPGGNDG